MACLSGHAFLKMNGLGNEIVVLDLRNSPHIVSADEARAISACPTSHFDQLMVLHQSRQPGFDAFMRIYNTDGSVSSACGNGTRCVAWALLRNSDQQELLLETDAGPLPCWRKGEWLFSVDMGSPRFSWEKIPLAHPVSSVDFLDFDFNFHPAVQLSQQVGQDAQLISSPSTSSSLSSNRFSLPSPSILSMGNPHLVFFVPNVEDWDVASMGSKIEIDPLFPERVNVSFAEVIPDVFNYVEKHESSQVYCHMIQRLQQRINLRVWERGAGETRACGSAACATAVAAIRRGLISRHPVNIHLPGGVLMIDWRKDDDHVLMTGDVELEHEGSFGPEIFSASTQGLV